MAAPLLAFALCLLAASPVSAVDDGDEVVISVGLSDSLGVVSTASPMAAPMRIPAQTGVWSTARAARGSMRWFIALWTIAGVMTVLLGLFCAHQPAPAVEAGRRWIGGGGLVERALRGDGAEALLWLRSKLASRKEAESAGDSSKQESDGDSDGETVDESAVWKFSETNGEQRSV